MLTIRRVCVTLPVVAFLATSLTWVVGTTAASAAPATVLVNESFTGATVSDPLIRGTGATCLTGATTSTAQLAACPTSQAGPVPPRGTVPGYLQLTDAANNKAGAVFYNRPIPASAGIDATFEIYQYGGTGADGITFFLVDGATQLTATGGLGGSLGYAQRNAEPGILGGYVGIGFDVYGNFYDDGEGRGNGCPPGQRSPSTQSGPIAPNTVVVRGPGSGVVGYCYLRSTTDPASDPNRPTSTLPGVLAGTTLANAKRTVHLVISPGTSPTITVQINFGSGFQTVLGPIAAPPGTPSTYKFGFSGSTGGSTDVHLLRNAVVGTVLPLDTLNLVKQVDRTNPLPPVFALGASIPYQFVVTNAGTQTLTNLTITDPSATNIVCPPGSIPPVPTTGSTVVCTGVHVVNTADVAAGQVTNTATASARDPGNLAVTSPPSSVTVPLTSSIGIVKSVTTPGPYRIGQSVGYSYRVTNTGGSALANVAVTDNRVATVTCPTTTLAPAAFTDCTGAYAIRQQDIAADGFLTNTATAVGTTPIGQKPVSPPATATIPVAADLSLTKTVDNAAPVVGSNVVYTVTVGNAGPSEARNIVVSDQTPLGATFISATPSVGTYNSATGAWNIPALAVGASATLVSTVRIDTASAVVNSATITTRDQPDFNPGNESGSTTLNPVVPTTDIAVLKSTDTPAVRVGQTFTSTVTVSNLGPFPATGVTVRDPIPIGVDFVGATGAGSYDPVTGIWTVGDLPFPGSASIQITELAVSAGFVINTAALANVSPTDINPNNDVATANVEVTPPLADLGVAKIVRPSDNALVGDQVAFVISATNSGPDPAPAVVVNEALSPGLTFVSANPEVGSYDPVAGVWTVGPLAVGVSVRLELFTTANATGFQANGVAITDPNVSDPNGDNNAASAGVQVSPLPPPPVDVGITKVVAGATRIARTSTVTFDLTASNSGPNPATGVRFTDVLPAGLDFVSATPSQGAFDSATGVWDVGTIAVGATPTLQLRALANGGAGTYTNAVALSAVNETDTNDQNNAASASVEVFAESDLSVTKSVSPTVAQVGGTATYTVTVTNNGPDDNTNVQLVETNRTPATFLSVVTSQGTFDAASRVWTIGSLPDGATATITVVVAITTPQTVVNQTVVFTADLPDPDLTNNQASATLVIPGADVSVSKVVDVAAPALGSNVTYTVGVANFRTRHRGGCRGERSAPGRSRVRVGDAIGRDL